MTNSNKKFAIIVVTLLVVLGIAMFFATGKKNNSDQPPAVTDVAATETPAAPVTNNVSNPLADQGEMPPQPGSETATAVPAATPPAAPTATIDVNAALSDRILGSTSAPMQITEHASLSCSHCAEFHKNTFKAFKKKYIDTNKVFFVFSDFPLNESAMAGSMIARCLPQDKYFDFLSKLFANQEKWAFQANFKDHLKTMAAAEGMSAETFDACLASKELQEGIANRMKGVAAQWKINSTPTFVINNKVTISGAYPIEEMSKIIDEEARKVKEANEAAKSAPTPAPTPVPAVTTPEGVKDAIKGEINNAAEKVEKAVESVTPPATVPPAAVPPAIEKPAIEKPAIEKPAIEKGAGAPQ